MTIQKKIDLLELILSHTENYADSFKADIIMYFEDDFKHTNEQLMFLNMLNSKEEIENWVDTLTSRFVMKFDSEFETENDFIYNYLQNKL